MENCKIFESYHEILANFDLKKLILINIKSGLMEFGKSLIILKEIKEPSGKFFRVWAKNQLRFEISRKILIYIRKSQGEIDFLPIFYSIFQDLCHFIQLWKITPFSTTIFFGFRDLPLVL